MLRLALAVALTTAAPAPHAVPILTVDGAVPRPALFDAAAFAALPHASATATIHGTMLTCTGAWLADVVAAAGVPTGEAVRGPGLATVVVARAADGYRVVFSLGEIERSLGRARSSSPTAATARHCPTATARGGWSSRTKSAARGRSGRLSG